MDEFLTDQQQVARVRGWVRQYAPAAVAALAVGFGGYFGYAQWQAYTQRQTAEASDLYEEFRAALDAGNSELAQELHQRMASDYAGSGYAGHTRLLMAKQYVDTTQPSLAAEELRWLLDHTDDRDLRQLARLRLARVYLYMDRPGDGLEVLGEDAQGPAWEQLSDDMRGDLYRAMGQIDNARAAYQAALERTGQVDASWIRLKLDHLGALASTAEESGDGAGEGDDGAEESDDGASELERDPVPAPAGDGGAGEGDAGAKESSDGASELERDPVPAPAGDDGAGESDGGARELNDGSGEGDAGAEELDAGAGESDDTSSLTLDGPGPAEAPDEAAGAAEVEQP